MKKRIKTLIIEDEKGAREFLVQLINEMYPELELLAAVDSVKDGVAAVDNYSPELIFLDIQLGDELGFELLEKVSPVNFSVIFTTAYDQYALKAIKYACLDYLLKPLDTNELRVAVNKVLQQREQQDSVSHSATNRFIENYRHTPFEKIGLHTLEGTEFIPLADILYCKADGPYTFIYLTNGKKHHISETLKSFHERVASEKFRRSHRSYVVNLDHIHHFEKGKNGCLVLSDDKKTTIPVSRRMKEEFFTDL
jgi:two-component system LytT family response regulator